MARHTPARDAAGAIPFERARMFHTLRSAYLERAHKLPPATIIYRVKRYDFHDALAVGLSLVQAGPLRAAWLLARSRVTHLEINEPLMLSSAGGAALAIAGLRVRGFLGGRPVRIVSYAMENASPFARPAAATAKARVRRALHRLQVRFVWSQLDRIVFATDDARRTYADALPAPRHRTVSTLIPALPAACACGQEDEPRDDRVLFLGALVERKGLRLVLDAWPLVTRAFPDARLTVVGKGVLEPLVRDVAEADGSVTLSIDPPRDEIHRQLRRSRVLALPSQPTAIWREQVGLPLVEGLAHGCTIVTTTETGLAGWLSTHGHVVIPPATPERDLADALIAALRARRSPADVVADLPSVDGRLAADAWMFSDAAPANRG